MMMSELADVLCSEMKQIYRVQLSFDGDLNSFQAAKAYRPGTHFRSDVDIFLSSIRLDNERKFYFTWEGQEAETTENYCLHIATAFSDAYGRHQNRLLDAVILHLKNLHSFVETARLPFSLRNYVEKEHCGLLVSPKTIPSLGAKFIGGTKQDRLRTFSSFYLQEVI